MTTFRGLETVASATGTAGHFLSKPAKPLVLGRVERVRRYGIECTGPFGDGVCFCGGEWAVGGEFVQKLRVKNVSTRMRKLKYKLPESSYFAMLYPELIELPPGIFVEIDVVFRPLEYQVYDDTIYFKICEHEDSGGFHVPCRALISTLQASVPPGLDFGLCPTNETMRFVFQVVNTGEVDAPFEWTCPAPFKLEPMRGTVPVGGAVPVEASIFPTDASVFVSLATCELGRGVVATKPQPVLELRLSAIGRYAHVVPSQERVDFGSLLVGQKEGASRDIYLRNTSTVPATVKCSRLESDREPVFTVSPMELVVPPQSEAKVSVAFAPVCAGCYTMEHFSFATPGGNAASLTCTGVAEGPKVRLYKKEDERAQGFGVDNSVNFRDVEVGALTSTALFLRNDSALPARFTVLAEEQGAFSFSRTSGTIPAELEVSLRLDFAPVEPTNYYQRVFVLIEHAHPLFLDLMGTGFIRPRGDVKEQRPFPLRHAHVQASRNRRAAGLERFTPPMLDEVLSKDGPSALFAPKGPAGTALLASSAIQHPTTRSGDTHRNAASVATELFLDPNAAAGEGAGPSAPPVYLSTDELDFGYAAPGVGERRSVTLFNTTHGKLAVQWVLPSGDDTFDVQPRLVDVLPGKSCEFKVTLRPPRPGAYLVRELELYAFFKTQRTFRLVKDPTMVAPWCCKVRAVGHSLPGEQHAGQVTLSAYRGVVEFPAAHIGDATYRTIRLDNGSNLPAVFRFEADPLGVFAVKPATGLVQPGGFALVLARFAPRAPTPATHDLRCVINFETSHARVVRLKGEGCLPTVRVVEADDLRRAMGLSLDGPAPPLYMKATCAGLVSSRVLTLRNPVRIPVLYSIEVPAKLSGIFAVTPRAGLLRGNQSAPITVSFAPQEHQEYKLRLTIRCRALAGPAPNELDGDARMVGDAGPGEVVEETVVTVIAPGSGAVVVFEPAHLDFGSLLVNDSSEVGFTIVNQSDCDVQYELHHTVAPERREKLKVRAGSSLASTEVTEPDPGSPLALIPRYGDGPKSPLLAVDLPVGILPAHSRTAIRASFTPRRPGEFGLRLVALVAAVDEAGRKIALNAEESAAARVGDKARLAALLKGVDIDEVDEDEPLPLSATARGQASFPTVVVTDARCVGGPLGTSVRHLWQVLGLEGLNFWLAQPLTRAEFKVNNASSPDIKALPTFPVRFVPCSKGSAPTTLVLQLTNPGVLPTKFEVHFPNEREVEAPLWADEGDPSEAQLRENRIIDELKSFEVFPRKGLLLPGESVPLTLSYKYESLDYDGKHDLGVHVKISQGKQFRLMLLGETLRADEPRLWECVTPADRTHRLMPVAIGTTIAAAPIQTTELMNTGDSDLAFEIDTKPLTPNAVGPESYGFQNLILETPSGTIAARSTFYLRWRFLPLEAREYAFTLPMRITPVAPAASARSQGGHGLGHLGLRVAAVGFDPREDDPHADTVPPINAALVPPPYRLLGPAAGPRLCALSRERVSLGRLPQRAVRHELLVLRNGTGSSVDFAWEEQHPVVASGLVVLSPMRGRVGPNSFATVTLTVSAFCAPCVVQAQVALYCRVAGSSPARPRSRSPAASGRQTAASGASAPRSPPGKETLVSRATQSRASNLAESTGRIERLTGREAALPSRPPPPPRTGEEPDAAAAAQMAASVVEEVTSHVNLWFEVVLEEAFVAHFAADVRDARIPRPRAAVAVDPPPSTLGANKRAVVALARPDAKPDPRPRAANSGVSLAVAHVKHESRRSEVATAVVGEAMGGLLSELLSGSEVRRAFLALPRQPKLPLFFELREKANRMARLELAFRSFDLDNSGTLSAAELKQAMVTMGLKARTSETKAFLRSLDASGDGEVDLKEFLEASMPPEVTLALEDAIDAMEHEARVRKQEERRFARMFLPSPGGGMTADRAALKLQMKFRSKQARARIALKKSLAESADAREEHRAANRLQGQLRGRKARAEARERAQRRVAVLRQVALGDPNFQSLISDFMESTVTNILSEALYGEFDLGAPPKQYTLAPIANSDDLSTVDE